MIGTGKLDLICGRNRFLRTHHPPLPRDPERPLCLSIAFSLPLGNGGECAFNSNRPQRLIFARTTMDHPSDDVVSKPAPEAASPSAPDSPSAKQLTSRAPSSKDLVDAALDFLSTSNNETLLGVVGLLAVATYVILGRIGLLLIGVALGVLLHASWEGPSLHNGSEGSRTPKKRRELALEVSKRLLDWPKRALPAEAGNETETGALVAPEDLSSSDLDYDTFQPATAAALRSLTDAIIQDYVKCGATPRHRPSYANY